MDALRYAGPTAELLPWNWLASSSVKSDLTNQMGCGTMAKEKTSDRLETSAARRSFSETAATPTTNPNI